MPPEVFGWLTTSFGAARGCTNDHSGSGSDSSEEEGVDGDKVKEDGDAADCCTEFAESGDLGHGRTRSSRPRSRPAAKPERPVGLTRAGFLAAYLYMYTSSGGDPATIWRDLGFLGYDVRPGRYFSLTLLAAPFFFFKNK